VTVFILDTLPKREEITRAANAAGVNNKLLYDVDKHVKFRYDYDSLVDAVDVPGRDQISVGKDIYGRHSNFNMPDHGLFIAGVVRSLASDANIECVRVLNDSCIGDMNVVLQALQDIHNRMSDGGKLHKKPVVINMSLVIPTDEEAKQKGVDPTLGGDNSIRTHLLLTIQSLVELGAVFAASAGNEGDMRENTSGLVPNALYPAAFANDNIKGIISVGAADGNGKPASYSCYPGINGITVYGGEIPKAIPAKHPSKKLHTPGCFTHAKGIDALVGIYSSSSYPSLSINDCEPTYPVPNNNAWAYWVGTSFATPIISGILARILEMKGTLDYNVSLLVHITNAAPAGPITWANLDTSVNPTGTEIGRMVQVTQCPPHRSEEEGKREAEVAAG
jgi:subtilisin family serine protease